MRLINSMIKLFLYQSDTGYGSFPPISTEFPLNRFTSLNRFLYIRPLRKTLCLSFISYSVIFKSLYAPVSPQHMYGFCHQASVQPGPSPFLLFGIRIAFLVLYILVEKFQLRHIVRIYDGGPFIATCILRCHMYKAFQKSRRSFSCDVPSSTPSPLYRNRCMPARIRTRPKC